MGLASIASASASAVRTQSEMDLYKVENKKRINVESTLTQARAKELDAKAQEADANKSKTIGAYFDKKIADNAAIIAGLGMIAAVTSAASSITSAVTNPNGSLAESLTTIIQQGFTIAGAILAFLGSLDEAEMLNNKFNELSKETKEDQKGLQALDVAFG